MQLKPDILEKLGAYCSYRERCIQEVEEKLERLNVAPSNKEAYINHLLELDVINEERFCNSFVRGKFRIKGWGRIKIRAALRRNKLSEDLISRSLEEVIPDKDYLALMDELISKKASRIKEKNKYKRNASLMRYLHQRGFETDLIYDRINSLEE